MPAIMQIHRHRDVAESCTNAALAIRFQNLFKTFEVGARPGARSGLRCDILRANVRAICFSCCKIYFGEDLMRHSKHACPEISLKLVSANYLL